VPDVPDGRGAPSELPPRGDLERLRTTRTLDERLRAFSDDHELTLDEIDELGRAELDERRNGRPA
jgi:hypothetical protein